MYTEATDQRGRHRAYQPRQGTTYRRRGLLTDTLRAGHLQVYSRKQLHGCDSGSYVPEDGASDQIPCPKGECRTLAVRTPAEAMPGHSVPEKVPCHRRAADGQFQPDQGQESCLEANQVTLSSPLGPSQTPVSRPSGIGGIRSCDRTQPGGFVAEEVQLSRPVPQWPGAGV